MGSLQLVPMTLKQGNEAVANWHRHHKPTVGHKFSIGAINRDGDLVGVVICGRPVARMTDQTYTLEVTRLVTNGAHNACSFLYGAAARAARALGYRKIQTFICEEEPGTSLVAAGWKQVSQTTGGTWVRAKRPRRTDQPTGPKRKFEKLL